MLPPAIRRPDLEALCQSALNSNSPRRKASDPDSATVRLYVDDAMSRAEAAPANLQFRVLELMQRRIARQLGFKPKYRHSTPKEQAEQAFSALKGRAA